MACTSYGVGAYVASEAHMVIHGHLSRGQDKVVVNCPGSHSIATGILGPDGWPRAVALADNGFLVVNGDMGQTAAQGTYGNDTARTRIGQLVTYGQGSFKLPGRSGKVHLLGGSGGATAAINYARQNPGNVASMYLICPLVDIEDFRTNWLGGGANSTAANPSGITAAEINKAYNGGVDDGGTAFSAAMASHNPIRTGNQAALAGVPIRMAYSTDDPYIPVAKVTAFAAAVNAAGGSATAYSQGAQGHTGLGIDPYDVVEFYRQNP